MLNNNKDDKRDEEIKNICINGTNNRYMMKKILTKENNLSKRTVLYLCLQNSFL